MSNRSSQNVLLRGVSRSDAVAAIERRLGQDEYRRVEETAAGGVRLTIRDDDEDVLVTMHPSALVLTESASGWFETEWAEHLAEALDVPTLAIAVYEDGPGSHVSGFDATGTPAPRFALKSERAGQKIPGTVFGRKKDVPLKDGSGRTFGAAVAKTLALPKGWLDLEALPPGETLVFRRRVALPALPKRVKATGFEPAAATYRGRGYAVGTIAFGAEASLESVASVMSELVRAFAPPDGLRVRVTRGGRSEVLPIRFSRTANIKAATLAQGGSVELTAGPMFDRPMAGAPIFWIANDLAVLDEDDAVPLHFGFALARPGSDSAERALAHAMSIVTEVAVDIEGCLAAVVTAQGAPIALADTTLAYEKLAGTAQRGREGRWLRAHARAPGWRTLVPAARVGELSRPPPDGVSLLRCPNGVLVQVDAATPFMVGQIAEIESWLVPVVD